MRTFLVKWPNGDATILTATGSRNLYESLDAFGSPEDVEIFLLPRHFLLDVSLRNGSITCDFDPHAEQDGRLNMRRWTFPDNAFEVAHFDHGHPKETFHDGVKRKITRDRAKLKAIRKQALKIKPLAMIGGMKGINELSKTK